jgi:ribosome-associated protein
MKPINALDLAKRVRDVLEDKKGIDIRLLDVSKVSSIADYVVIVTGNSPPHLKALFNEVNTTLKHEGMPSHRRAGEPDGGWMVVDYFDVIIHIFSPTARLYYAVEELWATAPSVD